MGTPEIFKDFNRQLNDAKKLAGLKTFFSVDVAQHYSDTCAIRSQQLILRKFGIELPQEQLMQEAIEHGWYAPGEGSNLADVGKLLSLHGVNATRYSDASLHDIHEMLAHGKQCIVAVDSSELWKPDSKWHYLKEKVFGIESADHALIVTDVIGDPNDPMNTKVVVTDPGTGEVAKIYSGAQFMDAHRDSHFTVVATDAPSPDFVAHHGLDGVVSFGAKDTPEWWRDWSAEQGEDLDDPEGVSVVADAADVEGDAEDATDMSTSEDDDESDGDSDDVVAGAEVDDSIVGDSVADLLD